MTEREAKISKVNLLAFGIFEFVVVFVTLAFLQAAGLQTYAAFIAGMVGGLSATLGGVLFFRRPASA